MRLNLVLEIPCGFRFEDILAYHGRDKSQTDSLVTETSFKRALLINQIPACISIIFSHNQILAELEIDTNCEQLGIEQINSDFHQIVKSVLGYNQAIELFEDQFSAHPEVGVLLTAQKGLRIAGAINPFDALIWAIIGQLISVTAATSIKKRLIELVNIKHSSGLYCTPDAVSLAQLTVEQIKSVGLTQTKAQCIYNVVNAISRGEFILSESFEQDLVAQLLKFKGIGMWTVNYVLLRGYGFLNSDMSLDVVVRNGIQKLLKKEDKIASKDAMQWLAQFSPYQGLVAAHLWQMQAKLGA